MYGAIFSGLTVMSWLAIFDGLTLFDWLALLLGFTSIGGLPVS